MRALAMVVGVIGALGSTAHADQCQLVDDDVAEWAPKLLAKGTYFVSQCEPCGDKGPSQSKQVASVSVRGSHGSKQVVVNGKDVDLAYVFVQTGKWTYTNAALLLGCPTSQVSSSVTVRPTIAKGKSRLPESCRGYERTMRRLMECDKMPQASKDAMQQAFDAMRQGWNDIESFPAEAIAAMADACKQGDDALNQAGKAICGW